MQENIRKAIEDSIEVKKSLMKSETANIEKAVNLIIVSLRAGGKLLIFGNGGSAADSQHIAAELVGRFKKERKALAAVALTTNSSIMTAIANDYGYDVTFARQVEALGRPGDVALGISTSGNSRNVIEALNMARAIGMKTIGLAGKDGGKMKGLCDVSIVAPSNDTARIQESHITVGHIICELVEEGMA